MNAAAAWRSITPISRPTARHFAKDGVFLCGDAARVVEPFTGEGISFALQSGELLADHLFTSTKGTSGTVQTSEALYSQAHRDLYGKGLWVNRLTRFLSEHPRISHRIAPFLLRHPHLLSHLTKKVITA